MSLGDFVMGGFVTGNFVMGDFVIGDFVVDSWDYILFSWDWVKPLGSGVWVKSLETQIKFMIESEEDLEKRVAAQLLRGLED